MAATAGEGFELDGVAAWPTRDGEPVFAEPWEGRAFGLAFDVVRRSGLDWSAFRDRLIAALAEEPERAYYESWVVALERMVVECVDVDAGDLRATRAEAATYRYVEDGLPIEVMPIAADEQTIERVERVIADHIGESAGFVPGAHVELRQSSRGSGIRSFDASGGLVADVDVTSDCWDELIHVLMPAHP
ncbi:MAG: hypothetical protein JWL72_2309 [Ilumatobacteraceae bacterium]|nr:hypothetical protein [Ilumatobacteraceae bacterium]MCU1388971.1 hypothetical protein [Ilumatobacteraceae bacterium]